MDHLKSVPRSVDLERFYCISNSSLAKLLTLKIVCCLIIGQCSNPPGSYLIGEVLAPEARYQVLTAYLYNCFRRIRLEALHPLTHWTSTSTMATTQRSRSVAHFCQTSGRISRASVFSHFERSQDLDLTHLNPGRVKPKTLKVILVDS